MSQDYKLMQAKTGHRHSPLTDAQWQVLTHVVQNRGTSRKITRAKCPLYYHAIFKKLVAKGYVEVSKDGKGFYPTDFAFERVNG